MNNRQTLRARRTTLYIGLTVLMVVASAWIAHSDSLFPVKKSSKATSGSSSATPAALYADLRAREVGDIINVTIAETTTATSAAETKTSHSDSANIDTGAGLLHRLFRDLSASASNSRTGTGTGSTTRSGSLVTTLSVTVREVLPSGALRVEGSRTIGINRETQRVTFSGIVRPEDVGSDNTISSNLVAEVQIRYDGKGIVGDTQRPGILSRIFRFLFQ